MEMTYLKDISVGTAQARRVHELIVRKAYYYLDASQGQSMAAFKFAGQFADIPAPLRTLAKQGKELPRSLWHAVYDLAYDDWSIT
jgi:hypothetical protein